MKCSLSLEEGVAWEHSTLPRGFELIPLTLLSKRNDSYPVYFLVV
jgi:hypothetical protein